MAAGAPARLPCHVEAEAQAPRPFRVLVQQYENTQDKFMCFVEERTKPIALRYFLVASDRVIGLAVRKSRR